MTVLFCCQASRHVRNLIIYSIICVPGYYYNVSPSFLYDHLLLFNLIGVLHYFCRDSNTKHCICSSTNFNLFTIRWDYGEQFWPKIVKGMLFVIFRLFVRVVAIPSSVHPREWVSIELSVAQTLPICQGCSVTVNIFCYLKLQRFGGYCLYQHHPTCPD